MEINQQLLFSEDCVDCSPGHRRYKIRLPTLFDRSFFPWRAFAKERFKLYSPPSRKREALNLGSCVHVASGGGALHNPTLEQQQRFVSVRVRWFAPEK